MWFIGGKRQQGKTTQLIKIAAENGGYIVCRSKHECGRINDMAHAMGVRIAFPLTYQEFIEKRYHGKGISRFYIDDADVLLQSLTEVPIEVVTFTGGVQ